MAHPAVFLDTEKTLIPDSSYANNPQQLRLIEGTAQSLKQLSDMGYKIFIITNQTQIAQGIIDQQQLNEFHKKIKSLLAQHNVFLDGIYYCPFHPQAAVEKYRTDSDMAMPKPTMILNAAAEHDINLQNSWMIGNSQNNIQAGKSAGCKTILIEPPVPYARIKYTAAQSDYIVTSIKEAVNIIKSRRLKPQNTTNQKHISEMSQPEKTQKTEPQIKQEVPIMQNTAEKTKQPPVENDSNNANPQHHYLKEIHQLLKAQHRQKMFSEFNAFTLVAAILQIIVFFLVIISIALVIKTSPSAYLYLQFAILAQLMALTFFLIQNRG